MTTKPSNTTLPAILDALRAQENIEAAPGYLSIDQTNGWVLGMGHATSVLDLFLAAHPSRTDAQFAHQLRKRAIDLDQLTVTADPDERDNESASWEYIAEELRRIADALDGGVGPDLHRGCPDPTVPVGKCAECRLVESVEAAGDPSHTVSEFTPTAGA